MNPHCLICESSAVLTQDNAKAIVQLMTVLNGVAREWQTPQSPACGAHAEEPMAWFLKHVTGAVASAASALRASDAFIQDMQTYQFGAYTCLCLRCGARFDAIDP
jgi:hypothetical protein